MIGGFQFRLNSNKLQYDFVINRKITKIIGDSATGKSELVATVAMKDDAAMNIHIACLEFSWEQYYTDLIVSLTQGKKYQYNKKKLNPCYIEKCCDDASCGLVKLSDKFASVMGKYRDHEK